MNNNLKELTESEVHSNEYALEELGPNDQGFERNVSTTENYIRQSKNKIKRLISPALPALTEYPSLTCPHILNAFKDSGVTYQLAHQLGITLGLSVDTIQMIERQQNLGGPAIFAMEIVNAWLKRDPKETNEETFKALEQSLRQVHLNNVIGKLRKDPHAVASKLTQVVSKVTQNITHDEAIKFGERIGLSRDVIDEVIQEQRPAFKGPFIAQAIYKEAERRNTFLRHSFVEKVTNGLVDVCNATGMDDDKKTQINERFKTIRRDSLDHHESMLRSEFVAKRRTKTDSYTASKHHHSGVVTTIGKHGGRIVFHPQQQPDITRESISQQADHRLSSVYNLWSERRALSKENKKFILKGSIALAVFFVIVLLFFLVIPLSLLLPQIEEFPDEILATDDTILYPLTISSFHLRSLEFKLLGGSRSCSAEILSIPCNEISTTALSDQEQLQFTPDNIYLLEGTSVSFSVTFTLTTLHQYCSPTYIWLFTDFQLAEDSANNHFEDLACSDPPDGVMCVKLNDTSPLIPQSSYYFIRCTNDPHCSFLSNITINNYAEYDFDDSKTNSIHNTEFNGEGILTMQTNPWYPQVNPICVLARLSLDTCDDGEYHIRATLNNYKRNPTIAYYAAIISSLTLVILVVLTIVWIMFLGTSGRLRQ